MILNVDRTAGARQVVDSEAAIKKAIARRTCTVTEPPRALNMRHLAVHAVIFLKTRPQHMRVGQSILILTNSYLLYYDYEPFYTVGFLDIPAVASLMLALENGQVQCWSDHSAGGFQGSFQAIHTPGDYVSAFATDDENEFLFTGTTLGYIKVWLLTNYLNDNSTVSLCMNYNLLPVIIIM